MKPANRTLWTVAVLALASAAAGCSEVTCSDAMGNFYDQGCALVIDGVQVARADAIRGCGEEAQQYEDAGCGDQRITALECLADATSCGDCDGEVAELNACMGF